MNWVARQVQDFVGPMVSGNTETLIGVTYDDVGNEFDFVVEDDLSLYDNTASGFLNSITATGESAGLDVTTSGNNIDVDLDLSEIAQSTSITGSDYLVGTTSLGTEARTLGRDFLQGSISAGSGISLSNTTEGVQISSTATGDITAVTVGTGLDGGATSGTADIDLDFGELETVSTVNGNDEFVMRTRFNSGGSLVATNAQVNVQDLLINTLTGGTDISVSTSGTSAIEIAYTGSGGAGDITSVTAGDHMTGGGTSGAVTLNVDEGDVYDALVFEEEFTSNSDESFAFSGNDYRELIWWISGNSNITITIPDPDFAPKGAQIHIYVAMGASYTATIDVTGSANELYAFNKQNETAPIVNSRSLGAVGEYHLRRVPDPFGSGHVWAYIEK